MLVFPWEPRPTSSTLSSSSGTTIDWCPDQVLRTRLMRSVKGGSSREDWLSAGVDVEEGGCQSRSSASEEYESYLGVPRWLYSAVDAGEDERDDEHDELRERLR